MFEQSGEVFEMIRSSFFAYFIVAFSVIISMSPCLAAKEFSAYRLQQFQLHGTDYGNYLLLKCFYIHQTLCMLDYDYIQPVSVSLCNF